MSESWRSKRKRERARGNEEGISGDLIIPPEKGEKKGRKKSKPVPLLAKVTSLVISSTPS